MSVLRTTLKRAIPPSARRWLRRAWVAHSHTIAQDAETGSGFCVIGDPEPIEHYARIYLGGPEHLHLRSGLNRGDFTSLARRMARQYGLAVISGVPLPDRLRPYAITVPRFVAMSVDLGDSKDAFLASLPGRSATDDLRRIRKYGYVLELGRDPSWAEEFVTGYHKPSAQRRHGAEGYVWSAEEVAKAIRDDGWEFLRVMRGNECISAAIAQPHASGYLLGRAGWRQGDPSLLAEGALSTLYWFSMQRARELGIPRIRLGGTPPYLEDGVFRYKMKWNAELDREETRFGFRHLVFDSHHPLMRHMLATWSLVGFDDHGRFVVHSNKDTAALHLTDRVLAGIHDWRRYPDEGASVV